MERASGGAAGLEEVDRKSASPSSAAGTRSAAVERDNSAGEEGNSAGEDGNSAAKGGRSAEEEHNSDVAVKGSLGSELGSGLGHRLGLGPLPGAGSSVCRAVAQRIWFGLREETSEVVGNSSAVLFVICVACQRR